MRVTHNTHALRIVFSNNSYFINPLVHSGRNIDSTAKISFLKMKGSWKIFSMNAAFMSQ